MGDDVRARVNERQVRAMITVMALDCGCGGV